MEMNCCIFCGSTDGAYNEVCNYHYMVYQNNDEVNEYIKKHEELQVLKNKLLELRT